MSNIVGKIESKVRLKVNDLKFKFGKKNWETFPSFNRILLYHGIDESGNTKINSRFISKTEFEKQIVFFRYNFNVVSLAEYFENKTHAYKPTICITFDDGYANNFLNALPILEKHKIPATFFITTIRASGHNILWADVLDMAAYKYKLPFEIRGEKFILSIKKEYVSERTKIPLKESIKETDHQYKLELQNAIQDFDKILKDEKLKTYWELLSPEQIEKLTKSDLVTIGSHGYYHNCLDKIPEPEVKFELETSKKWLEDITKRSVTALAFPDGSFSEKVISIGRNAGYTQFLSVDDKMKDHKENTELRSRMGMNPHISLNNQINAIIKGKY